MFNLNPYPMQQIKVMYDDKSINLLNDAMKKSMAEKLKNVIAQILKPVADEIQSENAAILVKMHEGFFTYRVENASKELENNIRLLLAQS